MVDLTSLSSRYNRAIKPFKNFYVLHAGTTRFLRGRESIRLILQLIHCCFQQWKNFPNRLTVNEVIAKSSIPRPRFLPCLFMPPPPAIGGKRHCVLRPSGRRPSVNTYFKWRDISVHGGHISMKLATNIYHVSGHCWKKFQGQRSNVKVIARSNVPFRRRHIDHSSSSKTMLFRIKTVDKSQQ